MRQFEAYMRHFSEVPGWFEKPAIALWDSLLSAQHQHGIVGNVFEVGVWKGKSAALLALHCSGKESCILVDTTPMKEAKTSISSVAPDTKCVYLQQRSELLLRQPLIFKNARGCRWIHVDGDHSSQCVNNDLEIADVLLGDLGIVAVDDFFAAAYPQVTRAVFQFLNSHPSRLSLILCGFNKAYLCRPNAVRLYLEFIKHSLYREMSSRGFDRVTIWKTAEPGDMNTFGITDRWLEFDYRGPDANDTNIYT